MKKIQATINGISVEVPYHYTILEACQSVGIQVPTLCHLKHLTGEGSCRLCMVELGQTGSLVAACSTRLTPGAVIETESPVVVESRKGVLDLLLSYHTKDCSNCSKSGDCRLQEYCERYGVESSFFENLEPQLPVNDWNPHFTYDANRCILCHRCVNVCHSLVGKGAIDRTQPGLKTLVSAVFNMDWSDPYCINCGNCVSVCPVGALVSRSRKPHKAGDVESVASYCNQCGMGCQLNLLKEGDRIVDVEPTWKDGSKCLLCAGGKFAPQWYVDRKEKETGKLPLIRKESGQLVECSWEEGLSFLAQKLDQVKATYGPEAIAGLASPRVSNEALYLFQLFMRVGLGSNHIDHYGTAVHGRSQAGFQTSVGFGGMMNPISDLMKTDLILVLCPEKGNCNPLFDMQIRQVVKRGKKLIVIDPKGEEFNDIPSVYLQMKAGSLVALANAMIHVIFQEGLQDRSFLPRHTEGGDELRACVKHYPPEAVTGICQLAPGLIQEAARAYASANKAYIVYACGEAQSQDPLVAAMSMCNLALVTGNLGHSGCGVNALIQECNEQGARDMGVLPETFPGQAEIGPFSNMVRFQRLWQKELNPNKGMGLKDLQDPSRRGQIRLLYLMTGEGEGMLREGDGSECDGIIPDPRSLPGLAPDALLVVQGYAGESLQEMADLILPYNGYLMEEGTMTSMDRRVLLQKPAFQSSGEGKTHWQILQEIMKALGHDCRYESAEAIFEEIRSCVPDYAGINYERMQSSQEDLFCPCSSDKHKGSKVLFRKQLEEGKCLGLLTALEWTSQRGGQGEHLTLMTYPMKYHYRRMDLSNLGRKSMAHKSPMWLEMNRQEGKSLGLKPGSQIRVIPGKGEAYAWTCQVELVDTIAPGYAWMPGELGNQLDIWDQKEEAPLLPGYKDTQVKIDKNIQ